MFRLLSRGSTTGSKRLVLGYDGGCGTCLGLAKRIDEEVGDKLEVQNLRDPQVLGWREEALGKDAPWAPTLFEVDGERVRAWTGWRIGAFLTRHLGAADTWKVMQVLGEMNTLGKNEEGSPVARVVGGFSRGQFLKGVGGAAVAMSMLSGVGRFASPAAAADVTSTTEVKGSALVDLSRSRAATKDLVNIAGQAWADGMKTGGVITSCQNGDCVTIINWGGDCSVSRVNGNLTLRGRCAALKAAKRTYSDGSTITAVSYMLSDTLIMTSERNSHVKVGGINSEAFRWRDPVGDGKKFVRRAYSRNGSLAKPVPSTTVQSQSSDTIRTAASSDPCGGCPSGVNLFVETHYRLATMVPQTVDTFCIATVCSFCLYATYPPAIFVCALTLCPAAAFFTCFTFGEECVDCA